MVKAVTQSFKTRITYVPRHNQVSPTRIKTSIIDYENEYQSTPKMAKSPWLTEKSEEIPKTHSNLEPEIITRSPINGTTSTKMDNDTPPATKSNVSDKINIFWQARTPKQKLGIVITLAVSGLLLVCTVAIVTPIMILVVYKENMQSSFTNLTASVCASGSCIGLETPYATTMVTVLYTFDGNFNDMTGYATGVAIGITIPGFIGSPGNYIGSQALQLSGSQQQYVQIPYVNLAYRSFTMEMWLFPTGSLVGDYGIFGQCDTNGNCLSLSLRNGRFTLSFDAMNTNNNTLIGTRVLSNNNWYHLAIVYDAVLYQQQIYMNGQIDAISRGIVSPFSVTSSSAVTTIGRSLSAAYTTSFFTGRIDHFSISAGSTRTPCQIYNDASLVAYFPFNTLGTWNDYSVNLFNGISGGVTTLSSGRVGQAISFSSNTSYFQSECFPSTETNDPPFTFALWINPSNQTNGGTLIHASNLQNGNGSLCYDILALTSSRALVAQVMQSVTVVYATQGPIIPTNTWTHVAVLYSASNGVRIYTNGQLSGASSIVSSLGTQDFYDPQFITLGNNSPLGPAISTTCRNGTIPYIPGPFIGAIDDFRIYNRELTNQELCVLANM